MNKHVVSSLFIVALFQCSKFKPEQAKKMIIETMKLELR